MPWKNIPTHRGRGGGIQENPNKRVGCTLERIFSTHKVLNKVPSHGLRELVSGFSCLPLQFNAKQASHKRHYGRPTLQGQHSQEDGDSPANE